MGAVNLPAFPDLMPWPCLDDSFDRDHESGWITVPNALFDRKKAALKVLPGVGHSAILEAPEQCMALIAPFLSTGALP